MRSASLYSAQLSMEEKLAICPHCEDLDRRREFCCLPPSSTQGRRGWTDLPEEEEGLLPCISTLPQLSRHAAGREERFQPGTSSYESVLSHLLLPMSYQVMLQ